MRAGGPGVTIETEVVDPKGVNAQNDEVLRFWGWHPRGVTSRNDNYDQGDDDPHGVHYK